MPRNCCCTLVQRTYQFDIDIDVCWCSQQSNSITYDVRSVPSLSESQSCVFSSRRVCVLFTASLKEGYMPAYGLVVCAYVSVYTLSADRVFVFKQIANETILHWFACIRNRNIEKSFFSQNVNRIFDSKKRICCNKIVQSRNS